MDNNVVAGKKDMDNKDIAIQISGVKKRYKLGLITAGTLKGDIQSWWARVRGKEDPNLKIGAKVHGKNEVFWALNGIDLNIYKGERIGIIGHNGAGKSTLLKLLARVTGPTEGEIRIDGRITSMLEVGTGFNGELTGRENIYLNGAILGMTKAEVDKKIEQIIDFSECRQFIDTPVKRYSSGMFVKLAFAVASHLDSEIMIMDEVLAVGDMAFQKKCLEKMSDVSKDEGRTILYVSHNMNTIRQLCSRCIVLDHGRIVFNGNVEEAIGVYLNARGESNEFLIEYDLTNKDLHYVYNENKPIILQGFSFDNLEGKYIVKNQEIVFSVKYMLNKAIKDVYLRGTISSFDGIPIGMFATKCDVEKETQGIHTRTFKLKLKNLVEGKYRLNLCFFQKLDSGDSMNIDAIKNIIKLLVVNPKSDKFVWDKRFWGCMAFDEVEEI